MAAATACDLLAKESAALRRDEASCLDLLRSNEGPRDQKTTQRLQRALRPVRKQLDEVDLAALLPPRALASAEASEGSPYQGGRARRRRPRLSRIRATAEKKRRKDAEGARRELEALEGVEEVAARVTSDGGQAAHTTSTWAVPIKVRTIYVPTRPAPNDADDVDQLHREPPSCANLLDTVNDRPGAAARACGEGRSRLEAQLQSLTARRICGWSNWRGP